MGSKNITWAKVYPDFEILLRLIDGLHADIGRHCWIRESHAEADICDIREDMGQMATEVKISFQMFSIL